MMQLLRSGTSLSSAQFYTKVKLPSIILSFFYFFCVCCLISLIIVIFYKLINEYFLGLCCAIFFHDFLSKQILVITILEKLDYKIRS